MSSLTPLQKTWQTLYHDTLPSLAKKRDACQPKWPVALDHCFARIILDNAVGIDRPWTETIKAPAIKNMTDAQLQAAIDLAHEIMQGNQDLVQLDEQSLKLRGKSKSGSKASPKRKLEPQEQEKEEQPRKASKTRKGEMADVWANFRRQSAATKTQTASPALTSPGIEKADKTRETRKDDEKALQEIRARIARDPKLPAFRKRVLTLLTQVPRGRYTTYRDLAAAAAMLGGQGASSKGCARAIGSAMRNNPFAPTVPCHRVLAADGKIGGFKGGWGEEGSFVKEKHSLLNDEGVRFDVNGKVVGEPFRGFVGT